MAVCQNLVPLVNPKIAGKWMLIPLKMVLIGTSIDPYPYGGLKKTTTTTTNVSSSASFPMATVLLFAELSGFTVGRDGGGTWLVVDQRLRRKIWANVQYIRYEMI